MNSGNEINPLQDYTPRQIKSSFLPLQFYPEQTVPPLPLNVDTSMVPTPCNQITSEFQQQDVVNTAPVSQVTMRSDAPSFSPSNLLSNKSTTIPNNSETESTSSFIYDLKKYKYDHFLTNLSCSFDRGIGRFGNPTGICTLNDDRLLVANFDLDSLLLIDVTGTVHQIYKDLPSPKDVLYFSSNPSQAIVATRKEAVILDIETKQVVTKSTIKGFYPWNIQYLKEHNIFAACDPSGERIIFLDKNLKEVGDRSFNDQHCYPPGQPYQKVYPYASYFLPDGTSYVLTHRGTSCQLRECTDIGEPIRFFSIPPTLSSYSIYVDNAKNCLIADKQNHQLVSINKDSQIEEYKCKSIQEPRSMTFLSTGTLCITDSSQSRGTNGGIAIISEVDLKTN